MTSREFAEALSVVLNGWHQADRQGGCWLLSKTEGWGSGDKTYVRDATRPDHQFRVWTENTKVYAEVVPIWFTDEVGKNHPLTNWYTEGIPKIKPCGTTAIRGVEMFADAMIKRCWPAALEYWNVAVEKKEEKIEQLRLKLKTVEYAKNNLGCSGSDHDKTYVFFDEEFPAYRGEVQAPNSIHIDSFNCTLTELEIMVKALKTSYRARWMRTKAKAGEAGEPIRLTGE